MKIYQLAAYKVSKRMVPAPRELSHTVGDDIKNSTPESNLLRTTYSVNLGFSSDTTTYRVNDLTMRS
jgi:hypothetical protein